MNVIKNIKLIAVYVILMGVLGVSCKKSFLDEYNPSNQTTDKFYVDQEGFERMVNYCYTLLRDISKQRTLSTIGTDVFA